MLPIGNFYESAVFDKICRTSFQACDVDSNGKIDAKELHIGILMLYLKINSKCPVKLTAPNHTEVMGMLMRHDKDENARLDFSEFKELSKELLGQKQGFRNSITFKMAMAVAANMGLLPLATFAIQQGGSAAGLSGIAKVPGPVLMGGLKMLKDALVPA
ncbi:unnamed protein product [Pedinophyceae sp. YPF-701]|nr:unnamed protein product [Pedinophyceae sp. YPF-701]